MCEKRNVCPRVVAWRVDTRSVFRAQMKTRDVVWLVRSQSSDLMDFVRFGRFARATSHQALQYSVPHTLGFGITLTYFCYRDVHKNRRKTFNVPRRCTGSAQRLAAVLLEPSLRRSSRQQLPDRSLTPIGREPVLLASQRGLELELGGRTSKARQPATASRWDLLDGERRSGVGSEPVSMISYTTLQRGLLFSYGRVCLHPNIRITASPLSPLCAFS